MSYRNRPQLAPLPIDVISIQSQVVYGYVGNNVATWVFQAGGHHVASVPTVILSNTPHYSSMHGGVICDEWFQGLLDDLDARRVLTQAKAVLIGFLGSAQQAFMIDQWLGKIQQQYPTINVYLDPVLGDYDTGSYVDPLLSAAYSKHLMRYVTGLMPNQYELEQLTGTSLTTENAIVDAARSLMTDKMDWVVVTSAGSTHIQNDNISFVVVTRDQAQWHTHRRVNSYPKGVGDLFSASLVEGLLKNLPVMAAAKIAGQRIEDILNKTHERGLEELDFISLSY